MGKEFELKYAAPAEALAQIRADFGDFDAIEMETVYFDTPDRYFSSRKMTLRLRRENNRKVCTLKTPGDGLTRGEWEAECDDIRSCVDMLCKLAKIPAPDPQTLEIVCGACFTRLSRLIPFPGGAAELALDSGHLLGGSQKTPLSEMELELKSGDPAALTAYAGEFARKYALQPQPLSKFQRAAALAEHV